MFVLKIKIKRPLLVDLSWCPSWLITNSGNSDVDYIENIRFLVFSASVP